MRNVNFGNFLELGYQILKLGGKMVICPHVEGKMVILL